MPEAVFILFLILFLFALLSPAWYLLILGKIVEKTEGKETEEEKEKRKKKIQRAAAFK